MARKAGSRRRPRASRPPHADRRTRRLRRDASGDALAKWHQGADGTSGGRAGARRMFGAFRGRRRLRRHRQELSRRAFERVRLACLDEPEMTLRKATGSHRARATPRTGSPIRVSPSSTSRRWRSLATLLRTTPATAMRGSKRAQPSATAAADCAWPVTSSTRRTGQPKRAAMSALAPVRPARLPDAVEKAHGAFRDDEVRIARRPRRRWPSRSGVAHGEAVEIDARLAGRRRVKGRVDVVGTALDAADVDAAARRSAR